MKDYKPKPNYNEEDESDSVAMEVLTGFMAIAAFLALVALFYVML